MQKKCEAHKSTFTCYLGHSGEMLPSRTKSSSLKCLWSLSNQWPLQTEAQQVKGMQVALGMTFSHQGHTGEGWKDGPVEKPSRTLFQSPEGRRSRPGLVSRLSPHSASLPRLLLLQSTGSRALGLPGCSGFSSCSTWASVVAAWDSVVAVPGLRNTGSITVVHGLSCSTACGIFPTHGSNLCSLHLASRFFTTELQGKP